MREVAYGTDTRTLFSVKTASWHSFVPFTAVQRRRVVAAVLQPWSSLKIVLTAFFLVTALCSVDAQAQWDDLRDTDGDGVNDNVDFCIDEAGSKANHGCPVEEVVTVTGQPDLGPAPTAYATRYMCPNGDWVDRLEDCPGFDAFLRWLETLRSLATISCNL